MPLRRLAKSELVPTARAVVSSLAAITFLVAALPASAQASIQQASAATASTKVKPCHKARGPFHISGTNVIGADGKVFIPYGITVPGLANADYQPFVSLDEAKIRATATDWCANTVRLQIAPNNLVGENGHLFSKTFLKAIEAEVRTAERAGLVVVLNAQTEDVGDQPAPTTATAAFWRDLAKVYPNDPQLIFDLFNQPRIFMQARCGDNADWSFWRRGGRFSRHAYLGMQTLVNDVRRDGAKELFWVEGPCFSNSLAGLGSHKIIGKGIVYAIQHPKGVHTRAQWYADFGWVIFTRVAPVVDAEWSNYAATKPECWPDAPKAVPAFLLYLHAHGIGLTAFQLKEGLLIKTKSLTDPTHILTKGKAKWRCKNNLDEGIGQAIMTYYRQHNT
jgi:Cellulase (glycosyl hydrolase family 5)